jgi:hypothetical protein
MILDLLKCGKSVFTDAPQLVPSVMRMRWGNGIPNTNRRPNECLPAQTILVKAGTAKLAVHAAPQLWPSALCVGGTSCACER